MRSILNVHSLYHDLNTVHPVPQASIMHLQGCAKGRTNPCPDCANEELWSDEEKWLVHPDELADMIVGKSAAPALSISGGEPLDQYAPLCLLLRLLRSADFSVLMWTGFEMWQVQERFGELLSLLDYIVTGPYIRSKRTGTIPFVSSSNQEIHCLTNRASKGLIGCDTGEYEVVVLKNGSSAVSFALDLY